MVAERFVNVNTGQPLPITGATNSVFGGSGANHSIGLVPDPGPAPGITRFLREDGNFVALASDTAITTPQAYGALANGVHDDTAAIQAALTAVAASGAILYFGEGTYLLATGQSITVPDNCNVQCSPDAIFLRNTDPAAGFGAYTAAMVSIGNNVIWSGGTFNNTTVMGTSPTSNTIGTGSMTFTTQAGLPYVAGSNDVWIDDQANPENWMEGVVTSYSGTTLVVNVTASGGSGTKTAWNISTAALYQCPIVLHGSAQSDISGVRMIGRWYAGIVMDGWNPHTGGSLVVQSCSVHNCYANAVQNRPFYMYGTVADCDWDDCHALGGLITNYGFNYDPANVIGTVNSIQRCDTINCTAVNVMFQGFAFSEQCFDNVVADCRAFNVAAPSGVGFLMQVANSGANPQDNIFSHCIADTCGSIGFEFYGSLYCAAIGCIAKLSGAAGFYINSGASGPLYCQYIMISGCISRNNVTQGVEVGPNSVDCSIEGIQSIANTGTGVLVDTGASYTRVVGRAAGNGTNFTDNGNNTVNLLTVH